MNDVELALNQAFRDHERAVQVDDHLLVSAIRRADRRRHRRQAVARACLVLVIVTGAVSVAAILRDDRSAHITTHAPALVDLGPVDRLPPGSDTILRGTGMFVLRDTAGEIRAFSSRAPQEGCRLVLATDIHDPEIHLAPNAVFHDPCHGEDFDRDGLHVDGPPALRNMYRYDVTTARGRIVIDTSLARPGQFTSGPGIHARDVSLDGLGRTDDQAAAWRNAFEVAGDELQHDIAGRPFVWVLGAFHDPATDIVTVPFTIDGLSGEMQVGPQHATFRTEATGNVEAKRFRLSAGTLVLSSAKDGSTLQGEMALRDNRRLRISVLVPENADAYRLDAPHLADIATLIDRTTSIVLH